LVDETCLIFTEFFFDCGPHIVGLMPNYDVRPARFQQSGRAADMRNDWPALKPMQDFCDARLHARAQAGSENENIQSRWRRCLSWLYGHSR
jgi:hypothetical protein